MHQSATTLEPLIILLQCNAPGIHLQFTLKCTTHLTHCYWRWYSPMAAFFPHKGICPRYTAKSEALFNSLKNVKEDHKAKTWLLNSPDPDLIKEQKKGHGDPTLHPTWFKATVPQKTLILTSCVHTHTHGRPLRRTYIISMYKKSIVIMEQLMSLFVNLLRCYMNVPWG